MCTWLAFDYAFQERRNFFWNLIPLKETSKSLRVTLLPEANIITLADSIQQLITRSEARPARAPLLFHDSSFLLRQPNPARRAGWEVLKAEGSQEHLADRVSAKLRQAGLLATTYGARNVRMDLDGPLRAAWEPGHVTVADLWSYYRRYPYLTRLRDRAVLEQALASAADDMMWETEGFALAERFDPTTGRYIGLAAYNTAPFGPITDSTLVVHPEVATQQLAAEQQAQPPAESLQTDAEGVPGTTSTPHLPGPQEPPVSETKDVRFFGVVRINPERYSRDFTRIAQEVLQHLAAVDGTHLEVTAEITATNDASFPPDKTRVIAENARTLKFDQYGFEDR